MFEMADVKAKVKEAWQTVTEDSDEQYIIDINKDRYILIDADFTGEENGELERCAQLVSEERGFIGLGHYSAMDDYEGFENSVFNALDDADVEVV